MRIMWTEPTFVEDLRYLKSKVVYSPLSTSTDPFEEKKRQEQCAYPTTKYRFNASNLCEPGLSPAATIGYSSLGTQIEVVLRNLVPGEQYRYSIEYQVPGEKAFYFVRSDTLLSQRISKVERFSSLFGFVGSVSEMIGYYLFPLEEPKPGSRPGITRTKDRFFVNNNHRVNRYHDDAESALSVEQDAEAADSAHMIVFGDMGQSMSWLDGSQQHSFDNHNHGSLSCC